MPTPYPGVFPDMLTCLSPGDRNTMPGIFANTLQLMEPRPPFRPLRSNPPHVFPPPTPFFPRHGSASTLGFSMWWRWYITILPLF